MLPKEETIFACCTVGRLKTRAQALEDALLLQSGDDHPLLAYDLCGCADLRCVHETEVQDTMTSSLGHRMDAGTLLMEDGNAESVFGAPAAEVCCRSSFTNKTELRPQCLGCHDIGPFLSLFS